MQETSCQKSEMKVWIFEADVVHILNILNINIPQKNSLDHIAEHSWWSQTAVWRTGRGEGEWGERSDDLENWFTDFQNLPPHSSLLSRAGQHPTQYPVPRPEPTATDLTRLQPTDFFPVKSPLSPSPANPLSDKTTNYLKLAKGATKTTDCLLRMILLCLRASPPRKI